MPAHQRPDGVPRIHPLVRQGDRGEPGQGSYQLQPFPCRKTAPSEQQKVAGLDLRGGCSQYRPAWWA